MATALAKENYLLHKLHSLSGVIPVGFYMVQHLTLNTFSLGGPKYFDGVLHFFESMPKHILLALEIGAIWIPLAFHAIYGFFIARRGVPNLSNAAYKYRENYYYTLQRVSGLFLLLFLAYHWISTTAVKMATNSIAHIEYAAWAPKLLANGGIVLLVYILGTLAASYHLAYGIWMFCIRWGITVSETSQMRMQKFSTAFFVVLCLLSWSALGGFLMYKTAPKEEVRTVYVHPSQIV